MFLRLVEKIKENTKYNMIKKSIFFTWMLSYLIITLLSMICNGIIYNYAKTAIRKELVKNSGQAMDQFKMSVDNVLVDTADIAKTLQNDGNISKLCMAPAGTQYNEYAGEALAAASKLKSLMSANAALSEIYIYYNDIDLITGGNYMYTKELFYERYYKDSGLTYEDWTAMFNENCHAVTKLLPTSNPEEQSVNVFYQIPAYLDEFDAMAVMTVDTSALLETARDVNEIYSDVGMFILSQDNEVIMTNGVVDSIPEKSNDSIVLSTVSDTMGWQYVSVIPKKVYDKKLAYFNLINIFNIFICLIVCGILSYFFAKKNARPFSMLKLIYNKDEDDMTLISNVLDDYRSAKQTKSEFEQSQLMEELINTGQAEILDELKQYDLVFPHPYFCIILFKLTNISQLFEDENDTSSLQKYDSIKLVIKNVLEEIINEKHYAHICKINGQIVAVVNINHDYILDLRSDLEEMLNRGKEFISSHFAFSFTPFVGGIHDVKTLHKSYAEAINTLQYRTFISTSDIVFSDEPNAEKTSELSAVIPAEKAKQLINLLQLGDVETSISMVNSLLRTAPHDSPTKYRVFLFDLISTLIHAFENIGMDDIETRLSDELCDLIENYDASEMPEKINEVITEYCKLSSSIIAENEANIGDSLSKKDMVAEIKQFIADNYTNQALNIAMIGEYFNITPYYVSNIFKKSENISMLDYISITRINKAKELLTDTDLNLEAIALQCGFSNIRTFMRTFQKFEIVTPGKYKELNKK